MSKAILMTGPFGEPERVIDIEKPATIAEIIEGNSLQFRLPTIAVLAGEPILRADWPKRMVADNDTLAFVAVPAGGGGNQGKQVIGLVAALALSIAAPMVGGWAAGALFGGSSIASSLISGLAAPSPFILDSEIFK